MMDPTLSRGYRNRNPGNIDFVPANKWVGQLGIEEGVARPRFARFASHEHGIRALAMLLMTYHDRHGLNTVRGIINRWAPPKENDTGAYVKAVAKRVGVLADQTIDTHQFTVMSPLVGAIIRHELGGMPYSDTTMERGIAMAGILRPW